MSFLSSFFGGKPKDLFLKFSPLDSSWNIVTWNFDLKNPSDRQWTVEVHKDKVELIVWQKSQAEVVSFFANSEPIGKKKIAGNQNELKDLMNLTLHSTLKNSLEKNHEFMTTPVSGAITSDMQNEYKALQWVQASFGMVIRALDNMSQNPDQILTASFFSGLEPETQETVLRVIIFNLDIFFYQQNDHSLRVVIFDDKNFGHGGSKTPTFQQIIKVTKPQFYDEIVKLVHRIAQVGEIR